MKFEITTAGNFYSNDKEVIALKELGFEFGTYNKMIVIKDNPKVYIDINDIQDLINLSIKYGLLIFDAETKGIIIYDNYIE